MNTIRFLLIVVLAYSASVLASDLTFKGNIVTPKGNVPDNASLVLIEKTGKFVQRKFADKKGNFEFVKVPFGEYQVLGFGANLKDDEDVGMHENKKITLDKKSSNPCIYNIRLRNVTSN